MQRKTTKNALLGTAFSNCGRGSQHFDPKLLIVYVFSLQTFQNVHQFSTNFQCLKISALFSTEDRLDRFDEKANKNFEHTISCIINDADFLKTFT